MSADKYGLQHSVFGNLMFGTSLSVSAAGEGLPGDNTHVNTEISVTLCINSQTYL